MKQQIEAETIEIDKQQMALHIYLSFSQVARDAAMMFLPNMQHEIKYYFNKVIKSERLLHNRLNKICGQDFIDMVQDDSDFLTEMFVQHLTKGDTTLLQELMYISRFYIEEKAAAKEEGRTIAVKVVDLPETDYKEKVDTLKRGLQIRMNTAQGTDKLIYKTIMDDIEKIFNHSHKE